MKTSTIFGFLVNLVAADVSPLLPKVREVRAGSRRHLQGYRNSTREIFVGILILTSFIIGARCQTSGNSPANRTVPTPTAWSVASRTANSAVWERTTYELSPGGIVVPHIHRYVQVATGLNHLVNGELVPSTDNITISDDGTTAMATNGQHKAYFPIDIATGVIKMITPGGSQLVSRPIALAYDDGSNAVLIALVTNSVGAVMGANHVVYSNAFEGVSANIMYTYTKAGFEQDVVLVGGSRPPVLRFRRNDTLRGLN